MNTPRSPLLPPLIITLMSDRWSQSHCFPLIVRYVKWNKSNMWERVEHCFVNNRQTQLQTWEVIGTGKYISRVSVIQLTILNFGCSQHFNIGVRAKKKYCLKSWKKIPSVCLKRILVLGEESWMQFSFLMWRNRGQAGNKKY